MFEWASNHFILGKMDLSVEKVKNLWHRGNCSKADIWGTWQKICGNVFCLTPRLWLPKWQRGHPCSSIWSLEHKGYMSTFHLSILSSTTSFLCQSPIIQSSYSESFSPAFTFLSFHPLAQLVVFVNQPRQKDLSMILLIDLILV